ncbi:MAG: hypothetical protein HXS54_08615 [Theionarchaea archaeon]|nr:hypothetical protein [Theionarchaea archaeon]
MVASFIITKNPCATEAPYLQKAFNNILDICIRILILIGDVAYVSRKNTSLVAAAGAIPCLREDI